MANGIIIIDKPADWTSMDVCAKLRGILKTKKVGHAGTLDPMATGVLPVFVGQATRGVSFAESGDKEYLAGLRLGLVTDTQDTSAQVLHRTEARPDRVALEAVLPRFTGEISQLPPMYSAIKIGGKKLYELARQGKEVERRPRPVTIHALELVEQTASGDYVLRVRCSKGTYVRTLCHDIGQALGCGGCMAALRRTMAAGFTLSDAVTLEQVQAEGEALLRPVDSLFRDRPAYVLPTPRAVARCRNGNPVSVTEPLPEENQIPIVGTVAAGTPILAEECIEDYLTFDAGGDSSQYFALRVRGESMLNAGILPDDLVVVRQQQTANNGEIVVALLGDEATVKRYSRRNGQVWLLPENEAYSPIDGHDAQILGKVAAVIRRY